MKGKGKKKKDSLLLLQGAWVQSLVRELRFQMACGVQKKNKKKEQINKSTGLLLSLPTWLLRNYLTGSLLLGI